MCGRGRCCLSAEQVRKAGKLTDGSVKEEDVKSIANFSPGMASPVVINNTVNQTREVQQMIFGLVPHFMSATDKPDHYKMFNASTLHWLPLIDCPTDTVFHVHVSLNKLNL
jgi:putative SOS response-associated peptidase YedK